MSDDVKDRCYIFNSFFWKKLTEKSTGANNLDNGPRGSVAAANHERVKKWTKVCYSSALLPACEVIFVVPLFCRIWRTLNKMQDL